MNVSGSRSVTEPEAEDPVPTKSSLNGCGACASAVPIGSSFCAHCCVRVKVKAPPISSSGAQVLLDSNSSVRLMMRVLTVGRVEHQERALLLLARKCIDPQERKEVFLGGRRPSAVGGGASRRDLFLATMFAGCLIWAPEANAALSRAEFVALRSSVRDPTWGNLAGLAHNLSHRTTQVRDDAVVLCGCLGTLAEYGGVGEVDGNVIICLVEVLKSGSSMQKQWVAYALGNLALNASNRETAAHAGAIPPLVALVRVGIDDQKQAAANALGNLAVNDANRVPIACAGDVPPLVTLVRSGTDEQKQSSANALANLALNNYANQGAIAREGGIPPLVTLVQSGTDKQKENSAYALGNLAYNNDANQVTIAREGGIGPLVTLMRSGADEQKRWAANVLRNLASSNSEVKETIHRAEVASSLRDLVACESADIRDAGKAALAKVRECDKVRGFLDRINVFQLLLDARRTHVHFSCFVRCAYITDLNVVHSSLLCGPYHRRWCIFVAR